MSKKVLVLGEAREGALRNVSFEAIAAAKKISGGGEVVGVLLGDAVQSLGRRNDSIWCRPCHYCGTSTFETIYI